MRTRSREGTATIVITGELDLCAAPALGRLLLDVLAQGPERLVLDLAGVTFIDCAAARELVAASRALPGARHAVIRRMSRPASRLLRLTGMLSYFRIVGSAPGYRPPRPRCGLQSRAVRLGRHPRVPSPVRHP